MKYHLITGAMLLCACVLYGLGAAGLGLAAFVAGGAFELWFWARLLVRRPAADEQAPHP